MATEVINGQALRVYLPEGLVDAGAVFSLALCLALRLPFFLLLLLLLVTAVLPAAVAIVLVVPVGLVAAKAPVAPISKATSETVAIVFFM